ncbi:MAG: DUF4349 domain-containing protein [Methanoregula sp.]|jgi:hypothetical protein|nr:DUF4349 domain-containing protein [Methanoregula sp.]
MTIQKTRCLTRSGLITGILIALLVGAYFPPVLAGAGSTDTGFIASGEQHASLPDESGADETGIADVLFPSGTGDRAWRFDVDTTSFKPDEYLVTASAVVEEATGTALFNVVERSSTNVNRPSRTPGSSSRPATSGYYITIDPIGDRYIGEKVTITGRTNLPEGADMLVQVYSSSFKPTQKSQGGEFSGTSGTIRASDFTVGVAALTPLKKDAGVVGTDTKIIRTGAVTLEVKDVTGTVASFQDMVIAQGGYLSSSTVQASGSRHTGIVVLRIPQARFETTLAGVKSAGIVKFVSTQGEDVTEEYIDLQAQKKSYEVQLAQYYVLMKKATKISDIIAVQQQIDRIQIELNRLEGRLKYLDSRIDLSTITITLEEPEPVHAEPGHNFVSAINKGIEGLFGLIDAIIITAITFMPVILIAGIGFCLYRKRKGKQPVHVVSDPAQQK